MKRFRKYPAVAVHTSEECFDLTYNCVELKITVKFTYFNVNMKK